MATVKAQTQQCPQQACSSFTQGAEQENLLLPRFSARDVENPEEFERLLNLLSDKIEKEFGDIFNPATVIACPVENFAVNLDTGRGCAFLIETATDITSITICCIEGLTCSFSMVINNIGFQAINVSGWPSETSLGADTEIIEIQPGESATLNVVPDAACNWQVFQPIVRRPVEEEAEPLTEIPPAPRPPKIVGPTKPEPCRPMGEAMGMPISEQIGCVGFPISPINIPNTCTDFVGPNFTQSVTGTPFLMGCDVVSGPDATRCSLVLQRSESDFGIARMTRGVMGEDQWIRVTGGGVDIVQPTTFTGDTAFSFGIAIRMNPISTATSFTAWVLAFEIDAAIDNGFYFQYFVRIYECTLASTSRAQNGTLSGGSRPGWDLKFQTIFPLIGAAFRLRACGIEISADLNSIVDGTNFRDSTQTIIDGGTRFFRNKFTSTLPIAGDTALIVSSNGPATTAAQPLVKDTIKRQGFATIIIDGFSICDQDIGFRDCNNPENTEFR